MARYRGPLTKIARRFGEPIFGPDRALEKRNLEVITAALSGGSSSQYGWVTWNDATMTGTFMSVPTRDMIPENIKEQLIVELYSK
ncbi:MAG: hypothetical protein EBZ16_00600 [Flavobacteriia bacterium]|nr:hypothetical protein [Flavobacteriia bacterium]